MTNPNQSHRTPQGQMLNESLFDVENVIEMPKVRDMTISRVGTKDVEEFSKRYHYTGRGGAALWRWGLWHGVVLHGVVAYNLPTREACEFVFGEEHYDKVWHMGRLILSEKSPRNSESRLIGGSLRAIEREYPDVWAVLTYAASDAEHIGYVYQATNAIYTGTGGDPVYYRDEKGARRSTSHMSRTAAEKRGWSVHVGAGKHRYLYVLGNKSQRRERMKLLQLESLPYPKA